MKKNIDQILTGRRIFFASPRTIKEFKEISADCLLTIILFTDDYIRRLLLSQQYADVLNFLVGNTHCFVEADQNSFDDLRQPAYVLEKRMRTNRDGKVEILPFLVLTAPYNDLLKSKMTCW
jgi:hypothetical protein